MLAPPRPPAHEELEALIREARARQRHRRLGVVAMIALLAGATLGVGAIFMHIGSTVPKAIRGGPPLGSLRSRCRASQLGLSVGGGGVAAGTAGTRFEFANRSSTPCVLSGWPSFRLVLRDGRQVTPRPHDLIADAYYVRHPPRLPRVQLRPGAKVSWDVNAADGTGLNRACRWSRAVLVAPPGARGQLTVKATVPYCGPRFFWVLPIGRRT
jgi:hypothetical protein